MRELFIQWLTERGLPGWLAPDYLFMLTLGIFAGCLVTLLLWRRAGHNNRIAADLLFWGVLGLFAGARVFHFLQYGWPSSFGQIFTTGGLALYGGLFGSLAAWGVYRLARPFPVATFLDCATPGFALGLFLGRIGCFLAGCNGGTACSLPWSVQFPPATSTFLHQVEQGLIDSKAALSLPVHPTQLYESLFGLLAFLWLLRLFRVRQWPGQVFFAGMLWYSVYRFGTEWLRNDAGGYRPFDVFTFSQLISLIVAVAAAVSLWRGHSQAPAS